MKRIGVCGAAGRMGRAIIRCLCAADRHTSLPEAVLGAALEAQNSPTIGNDAGELVGVGRLGVVVQAQSVSNWIDQADVLINFTLADALPQVLSQCREVGKPVVIGTTGLDEARRHSVYKAAADIPIVFSPNMSVGVNLCFDLVAQAAEVMGNGSDVSILELHHRGKKDAPSGTALHIGAVLARVLDRELTENAAHGDRDRPTISVSSLRAGDAVGEHTVLFSGEGERVEITHRATSRQTFASGAIRAACWLAGREPGCYDMQDVLGLRVPRGETPVATQGEAKQD